MNPLIEGRELALLAVSEAQRLHIVGPLRKLHVERDEARDVSRVFADTVHIVDVPGYVRFMEIDAARRVIADLLCAEAYPHGL